VTKKVAKASLLIKTASRRVSVVPGADGEDSPFSDVGMRKGRVTVTEHASVLLMGSLPVIVCAYLAPTQRLNSPALDFAKDSDTTAVSRCVRRFGRTCVT
jgi:hypothetical protein